MNWVFLNDFNKVFCVYVFGDFLLGCFFIFRQIYQGFEVVKFIFYCYYIDLVGVVRRYFDVVDVSFFEIGWSDVYLVFFVIGSQV